MDLSQLKPPAGQVKKQRRIGQGMGTGRGKYSGRGAKGARSISGYSKMRGFEGGQMPLHRRLPKRGFTNPFKKEYSLVNVGRLEKLEATDFTPESLVELGVLSSVRDGLKVLGTGDLKRKINIKAHAFSAEAEKKITAAGGKIEKIAVRPPGPPPKEGRVRKPAAPRPPAPPKAEAAAPPAEPSAAAEKPKKVKAPAKAAEKAPEKKKTK